MYNSGVTIDRLSVLATSNVVPQAGVDVDYDSL